ncbi:MAG TPA: hypothetical protein VIM98_14750 [Dyella sp.]|uniref:hypothetical protein n=1 Tax=Dyella sp. TaxID=1869338 RepID=UPI002F95DF17
MKTRKSTITAETARKLLLTKRINEFKRKSPYAYPDPDLDAPGSVDGQYADNLLPLSAGSVGTAISIPGPPGRETAMLRTLIIYFDEREVNRIEGFVPTYPYQASIPARYLLTNGTYEIFYDMVFMSGLMMRSRPLIVTIDNRMPNRGNVPAAPIFPVGIDTDGITQDYLDTNGEVIMTIPRWDDIASFEGVNLIWDSRPMPRVSVTDTDVSRGLVEVPVASDFIRQGANLNNRVIDVYYYLTSRAGRDGLTSLHAEADLIVFKPPANLPPPNVLLAIDGLIDLKDADAGVEIEIENEYDNYQPGDMILGFWGTVPIGPVQANSFPVKILVPRATIVNVGSGPVGVTYQVIRGGRLYDSPALPVLVDIDHPGPADPDPETPVNPALQLLTVVGGSDDVDNPARPNRLTTTDRGQPASIIVPFYVDASGANGPRLGERITVYWGVDEKIVATHEVTGTEAADPTQPPFILTMSATDVDATPNGTVNAYYTLRTPLGAPADNETISEPQPVQVELTGPGGPGGLPPAEFDVEFPYENWLYREQTAGGLKVIVRAYDDWEPGDHVELSWQAFSTENGAPGSLIPGTELIPPPTAEMTGNDIRFIIPYDPNISLIGNPANGWLGMGLVDYVVIRNGVRYPSTAPAAARFDLY